MQVGAGGFGVVLDSSRPKIGAKGSNLFIGIDPQHGGDLQCRLSLT
jgi:hypothetical protein